MADQGRRNGNRHALSIQRHYTGDTEEFDRSLAGEPWLILAAIITIYIVLGLLYESAIHPFTILYPSVRCVGALVALSSSVRIFRSLR